MLANSSSGLPRRASESAKRAHPSSSASSNASTANGGLPTPSPSPPPSSSTSTQPPPGGTVMPMSGLQTPSMSAVVTAAQPTPTKMSSSPGSKGVRKPTSPSATAAARQGASNGAGSKANASGQPPPVKKARKPYTISRQREIWTKAEHELFVAALKKYGRSWKQIESHVRTKSVIQIRSHAQKFFIKAQKNNSADLVPPPRPKRRSAPPIASQPQTPQTQAAQPQSSMSSAALASPAHIAAYAAAAQQLAQSQQHMHMQNSGVPASPQLPLGFPMSALQPAVAAALQHQISLGQQAQANPQQTFQQQQENQQRFAAAVQQNLQLLSFGALSGASPFFPQHAMAPGHAMGLQGQQQQTVPAQRASAAKAISPRLPGGAQHGSTPTHATPSPGPSNPAPGNPIHSFPLMAPQNNSAPLNQHSLLPFTGLIPQVPPLQHNLPLGASLPQIPQFGDLHPHMMPTPSDNRVYGADLAAIAPAGHSMDLVMGVGTEEATGDMTRASSVPISSPCQGSAAPGSAATAAAAVAASGGAAVPATSPNFTRIYGFFASLLNPNSRFDEEEVISTVLSSTLDGEIIKLLVRNLEVNLASDSFREQLSQTSQEQQANQEHAQAMEDGGVPDQSYSDRDDMGESIRWFDGSASGNG